MRWFSGPSLSRPAALLLLGLMAGCAGRPGRPVRITDHRAYLLAEVPEQFDIGALEGRHIVIDPGHGGPWPGAVGPNGVREADVNLGVGLHLWGLLTEAGAHVEMTRTADSQASPLPKPTLKQDLQARAEFATARDPDVFLSLHHNADIIPGSQKNDLETYYQLRGGAPSLDLAQAVHRHHARNLGERANAILPGNFHVLRETAVPAILGEASYVSAEANAEHLAFAAMQRLEAEAYFLGLVEYFSRGVPRVVRVTPADGERHAALDAITIEFALDRGVPMDPATIRVTLNNETLPVTYDVAARTAHATVAHPLPSGTYTVEAWGRNVRGNATRPLRSAFTIDAAPHFLTVHAAPEAVHPDSQATALVSVRVLDAQGYPVLDGTRVTFAVVTGELSRAEATTADGMASAYWQAGQTRMSTRVTARCGDLSAQVAVQVDDLAAPWLLARVLHADTGDPIAGARAAAGEHVGTTNGDGLVMLPDTYDAPIRVSARGYWGTARRADTRPLPTPYQIPLVPVAGGALHGQVIAIDAADGGAAAGARGPTGLRAADVNLRVARYLAAYLESAGAVPVLTRMGDATTSPFQRVETSEAAAAARFVSIRHGGGAAPERVLDETGHATTADLSSGVVIEHYPTSADGKRLAGFIREALADVLHRPRGRVLQSVAYELTHTGCPAVRVQALSPVDPETEILLSTPGAQRRVAYALFQALARDFGADPTTFGAIAGRVENEAGKAVAGATVTVNRLWLAVTDGEGRFAFAFLPPGEADVQLTDVGGTAGGQRALVHAGAVRSVVLHVPAATAAE